MRISRCPSSNLTKRFPLKNWELQAMKPWEMGPSMNAPWTILPETTQFQTTSNLKNTHQKVHRPMRPADCGGLFPGAALSTSAMGNSGQRPYSRQSPRATRFGWLCWDVFWCYWARWRWRLHCCWTMSTWWPSGTVGPMMICCSQLGWMRDIMGGLQMCYSRSVDGIE